MPQTPSAIASGQLPDLIERRAPDRRRPCHRHQARTECDIDQSESSSMSALFCRKPTPIQPGSRSDLDYDLERLSTPGTRKISPIWEMASSRASATLNRVNASSALISPELHAFFALAGRNFVA